MKSSASKYIGIAFRICSYTLVILYLLSCCSPYIHPQYFFGFTFLAIMFPILFICMLLLCLLLLFINRKYCIPLLLILCIGYTNIKATIGFHVNSKVPHPKQNNTIRIVSYNIQEFLTFTVDKDLNLKKFDDCIHFLLQSNPDILCLQDVDDYPMNNRINIKILNEHLHFPYTYFSKDADTTVSGVHKKYGTMILSKLPIIDSGRFIYSGNTFPESLAFVDVVRNADTIRIYNTHLRSMHLNNPKNMTVHDFGYTPEDTNIVLHSTTFQKLKYYDTSHIKQAEMIKKVLDKERKPFVFCADLNSVPASFVYHHISKGLTDAFLKNEWGCGRTYPSSIPFLRIDVVLMSSILKPIQYYSPDLPYSDHNPIITDIRIH